VVEASTVERRIPLWLRRGGTALDYSPQGSCNAGYDNIQHQNKTTEKQSLPKVHGGAAIGWNFKSRMIFYKVNNRNGAITNKAYIDQILEVEVRRWLNEGHTFILEQDGAGSHGGSGGEAAK